MSSPVAPAKAITVSNQPERLEMNLTTPSTSPAQHEHHKASRLRGGGAGKDCLLGMFGCFICFECCEGCCDCVADIICCPCEMCC